MNKLGIEVREELFRLQDKKYQQFHSNLSPGVDNIIGVRVPVLRKFAKELFDKHSFSFLFSNIGNDYYEEIMIKGMLIGFLKDIDEVIKYSKLYIPLISNWGLCDTFCAGLKITKKNKQKMRDFILSYLNSSLEFEVRFLLVMILDYYIEEEYLEDNFKIFDSIKLDDYYVSMALSWAISICFVKFYDETVDYFKRCKINNFSYNKAITKACESYRLDNKQKEQLKFLRK